MKFNWLFSRHACGRLVLQYEVLVTILKGVVSSCAGRYISSAVLGGFKKS